MAKDNEAKLMIEQQAKVLQASILAQDKERKRIASDLHDSLISKLMILKFQKQLQSNKVDTSEDQLLMDCISTARRISQDLIPPMIKESALNEVIEELTLKWKKVLNIHYVDDIRTDRQYSSSFKIQLARIVQEILNNTLKYAESSQVQIKLKITENYIALYISDNGIGFSVKNVRRGLGLESIQARVDFLNGKYKLKSQIGSGTSFITLFNQV